MAALKFIFSILLLTTSVLLVRGQITDASFVLPSFNDSVPPAEIVRQAEAMPSSPKKVRQLLAAGRLYLDQGRHENLDTSLTCLLEAFAISTSIRDTAGRNEVLEWLCENYMLKGRTVSAERLLPMTNGNERIRLLLTIAEGIVGLQPVEIPVLEKAQPYLSTAIRLADSLRSTQWRYECLMVQAKYFFEHDNLEDGKNAILSIIKSCDSLGDRKGVGHYWSEMNKYMPISRSFGYHLFACRQSISAYTAAGDQHDALYSLRDLAVMHRYMGRYDSAEKEFMTFLSETAKAGTKPSFTTNYDLVYLYLEWGDPVKGLDYALRALNQTALKGRFRILIYEQLTEVYQLTGNPAEELNYGRLAVQGAVRFKAPERHYYTTFVIEALIKQNQPEKALAYLQEFNAGNPALSADQQEAIAYDNGLIYDALGDYPKAAPWFRRLADLDTAGQVERNAIVFSRSGLLDVFQVHLNIGRFYMHWNKYQEARPFLRKALGDTLHYKGYNDGGELQWLLYKADSATGDLRSAIGHYLRYTHIKDSLFGVQKMRQFETLEVQYKTRQREQSIRLLQSESDRRLALFNEASFARKIEFCGIILLLIVATWAYYAYRAKRRNVKRLIAQQSEILAQQHEINEKNLTLEHLLGEKNELLVEKNLLLQEVHHRVKNNLHTVMSLLESQCDYLSDKGARDALLDSQNRIQTISLLHQKLYWNSNVTSLEMAPYITELCAFLGTSLGARERRIAISQSIEPIQLDISVGLPIGLLLNEAITNALKHAFPENVDQQAARTGHVDITMRQLESGFILLQIVDDGLGMSSNGGGEGSHSLGMTLMKSIGQKLDGKFAIHSSNEGVRVVLEFKPEPFFSEENKSLS